MDITPLVGAGRQIIQSYNGGRFKISGRHYESPVLVFPEETLSWAVTATPPSFADFQPLIVASARLDVVLFGCGPQFAPLDTVLRRMLKEAGMVVDVMDTGAACRTYNVLMADGRRVAAALLPV